MDRRAILAFALCIAALLFYSSFVLPKLVPPRKPAQPAPPQPTAAEKKPERPAPAPVTEVAKTAPEPSPAPSPAPVVSAPPVTRPSRDIILENDVLKTVWTTRGAALKSITLKQYKDSQAQHALELLAPIQDDRLSLVVTDVTTRDLQVRLPLSATEFQAEVSPDGQTVTLGARVGGNGEKADVELSKTVSLEPGKYHVNIAVGLKNLTEAPLRPSYSIGAAAGIASESPLHDDITALIAHGRPNGGLSVNRYPPAKLKEEAKVSQSEANDSHIFWAGSANKYFAAVLCPKDEKLVAGALAQALHKPDSQETNEQKNRAMANAMASLRVVAPELASEQAAVQRFVFFAGPMDEAVLAQYPNFARLVDYGSFASICVLIISMLGWFYHIIPNYGVAIILLTILVKVVLHPLTRKSQVSMYRMQQLQPKISELKEKHKNNKQKLGQEQMALFKEHGVNPMSGCLPMLLQLPVFLALFNALRVSISLRQAPFVLWIRDLSRADTIGMMGTIPINILPVFMTVVWFYQQKTMPKSTDPQMVQQQKMMSFMPIFFGFLLYSMPSGLTLYWTVSTLLGILEQYLIKKSLEKIKPA